MNFQLHPEFNIEKWKKDNQLPEDAALEAYEDKRREAFEEAKEKGLVGGDRWSTVDSELSAWFEEYLKDVPQEVRGLIGDYVLQHRADWILDLPNIARQVEVQRAKEIEGGYWWVQAYGIAGTFWMNEEVYQEALDEEASITDEAPVGAETPVERELAGTR